MKDYLVFVHSKKKILIKRLKKRKNFNNKLFINVKRNYNFQQDYKKKKSHFIIKNNFTKRIYKKRN